MDRGGTGTPLSHPKEPSGKGRGGKQAPRKAPSYTLRPTALLPHCRQNSGRAERQKTREPLTCLLLPDAGRHFASPPARPQLPAHCRARSRPATWRPSTGAGRSRFFPAVAGRLARGSARPAPSEQEVHWDAFSLKPEFQARGRTCLPYPHGACTNYNRAAGRQLGSQVERAAGEDEFISN